MTPTLNCILVIDDDEATNYLMRLLLQKSACCNHIRITQGGSEALHYLNQSNAGTDPENFPHPDLIFLDINMPAMNGWEFIEEYKKLILSKKIVVVMLTTSLFPKDIERAEAIPELSGYETKPLSLTKIDNILQQHFKVKIPEKQD